MPNKGSVTLIKNKLILSALILSTIIISFFAANDIDANIKDFPTVVSESPMNLMVPPLAFDNSSITLVWHKPVHYNNIVNYNVYMNGKRIGSSNNSVSTNSRKLIKKFYNNSLNKTAVKINMHTYTVTGLKPNTLYKFTVKSVNSNGKESPEGNPVIQRTRISPKIFDVTKYGAIGDGKTLDTKAIQSAINACSPGGEVLLPSGKTFKSGSIWVKGGIIFKVDGKLLGSENPLDYIDSSTANSTSAKANEKILKPDSLINIDGKFMINGIKLIGKGIIDGNGWKQGTVDSSTGFPNSLKSSINTVEKNGILAANQYEYGKSNGLSTTDAYSSRSNLISIKHINNVYIGDGLSFVNPSQHVITTNGCNNVVLNEVLIKTFDCNNADGIDFDSQGLIVVNSVFDTGDDDINFTAGKGIDAERNHNPVSNVWIFNNYFGRGHGAVVAGSNTAAWIENILAEDNILNGTASGLRCKTAKGVGGGAKNITFRDSALSNITDGSGQPFIFTANYSDSTSTESFKPASDLPQFKHIFISNCSVNGSKNNAIFVSGLKGACEDDIHFTNVFFTNTKAAKIDYMSNSTFKNVIFDKKLKNPWLTTNCTHLSFIK